MMQFAFKARQYVTNDRVRRNVKADEEIQENPDFPGLARFGGNHAADERVEHAFTFEIYCDAAEVTNFHQLRR